MAVKICSISDNSPCKWVGIPENSELISINDNEIDDVLDYRFYQYDASLKLVISHNGKEKTYKISKDEYEELGLNFETYLMDSQHSCKNNCIFCFIDQLPKGLRKSLYFKDDDSRLSFLFGNYITLTNISEHEIERIIKLHISPVNISVHTTNPELRCEMMHNRFAGDALKVLYRLADAGITINCQLVLCPGYNDGRELERTLSDLIRYENIRCIAAVPVGLTEYRYGLKKLEPFNKKTASDVIDIMNRYGDKCIELYNERRIYAADEFYILSMKNIPDASYYGEFLQLENGVGMWALLKNEAEKAISEYDGSEITKKREISIATGEAAYPLIKNIVDIAHKKWHNLICRVYAVKNNFFGGKITVTGLVTGSDIINQLKGQPLGSELLFSSSMLRNEGDMFLDNTTLGELSTKLSVKVIPVNNDGYELIDAIKGEF